MPEKYLHPIDAGGVHFPNNLWLAPLAGYSHRTLRIMARRFGAGYAVTEMVSVEGIVRDDKKTWRYAEMDEELTGIQLFGKGDPDKFNHAARLLIERLGVKIIDINFGCPVKKVIRNGAGSALLKTPSMMGEIVSAVKETGIAVSAKIRSGFDDDNLNETIPAVDKAGADIIILHPRTAKQVFSGHADWSKIRKARDLTDKILIANGDVVTPADAKRILDETKADGVMIGRGAVGKPYLFKQIIDFFNTGEYLEFTQDEIKQLMLEFAGMYVSLTGQERIVKIRSPLIQYVKGYRDCKQTRHRVSLVSNIDELRDALEEW